MSGMTTGLDDLECHREYGIDCVVILRASNAEVLMVAVGGTHS